MQIKSRVLVAAVFVAVLSVSNHSTAQQADWLKDLEAQLPQFKVSASAISRQGILSPDGKWLVADYITDPGTSESGTVGTEQYGLQILDRTGKVVQEVTRGNRRFLSVSAGFWGKDSKSLYFAYGSRIHPGIRDTVGGPVIWEANLGMHTEPPPCVKTSFAGLPVWSPWGQSYLVTESDHSNVKSNGDGLERVKIVLINAKSKSRIQFRDADLPAWSPDGRWIRLVNEPAAAKGQYPYLRIADSRNGKEHALTATTSSASENGRYGWASATLNTAGSYWLADSKQLLMGVNARKKDGGVASGCFIESAKDGSHSFIPDIYPLSGSRDGRSILIQMPDKKLFILDIVPISPIRE